jgi:hypothetical protein
MDDELCENVIKYISDDSNNYNKIIALILRDTFLNELIYISYTNDWKQYNMKTKEWKTFNPNVFINKLPSIRIFFEDTMKYYVEAKNNLSKKDKKHIKHQITNICKYIDSIKGNNTFINDTKRYFYIGL